MWMRRAKVAGRKMGDYFESIERLSGPWTMASYYDDELGEDVRVDEGFFELDRPFSIATSVDESRRLGKVS
ncbi:hypothetical protein XANCAGTX0491_009993 [Xanthoria calcicola]